MESSAPRIGLGSGRLVLALFLLLPLLIIVLYAFNESAIQSWPITTGRRTGSRSRGTTATCDHALWLSVKVALSRR